LIEVLLAIFGLGGNRDGWAGALSGTIHAIDGMFIRSGEDGMTYRRQMNNGKHDN
jgi:hypothetical protein